MPGFPPSGPTATGVSDLNTSITPLPNGDRQTKARRATSLVLRRMIQVALHGKEDGGSLVEFAMVFPILMLIVTAIFTFGIAFNNYVTLTDAVRIAGRQMAISSGLTLDPCAAAATAVYHAAPLLSQSNLTFSYTINGVAYSGASCSSTSQSTGAPSNLKSGNDVTVTVTYPCNLTIWGTNYAPSCTLSSSTTEKVQ